MLIGKGLLEKWDGEFLFPVTIHPSREDPLRHVDCISVSGLLIILPSVDSKNIPPVLGVDVDSDSETLRPFGNHLGE